jgi:hypothetical protein
MFGQSPSCSAPIPSAVSVVSWPVRPVAVIIAGRVATVASRRSLSTSPISRAAQSCVVSRVRSCHRARRSSSGNGKVALNRQSLLSQQKFARLTAVPAIAVTLAIVVRERPNFAIAASIGACRHSALALAFMVFRAAAAVLSSCWRTLRCPSGSFAPSIAGSFGIKRDLPPTLAIAGSPEQCPTHPRPPPCQLKLRLGRSFADAECHQRVSVERCRWLHPDSHAHRAPV